MYQTTDNQIPYFKFKLFTDQTHFKVLTNILNIDKDPENVNNKKLFFAKEGDYTNLIPYMYDIGGEIKFLDIIPNCQILNILIKLDNFIQYEINFNTSGPFYIVDVEPIDESTQVSRKIEPFLETNKNFKDDDLISDKVYLEQFNRFVTTDNTWWTTDSTKITTDMTKTSNGGEKISATLVKLSDTTFKIVPDTWLQLGSKYKIVVVPTFRSQTNTRLETEFNSVFTISEGYLEPSLTYLEAWNDLNDVYEAYDSTYRLNDKSAELPDSDREILQGTYAQFDLTTCIREEDIAYTANPRIRVLFKPSLLSHTSDQWIVDRNSRDASVTHEEWSLYIPSGTDDVKIICNTSLGYKNTTVSGLIVDEWYEIDSCLSATALSLQITHIKSGVVTQSSIPVVGATVIKQSTKFNVSLYGTWLHSKLNGGIARIRVSDCITENELLDVNFSMTDELIVYDILLTANHLTFIGATVGNPGQAGDTWQYDNTLFNINNEVGYGLVSGSDAIIPLNINGNPVITCDTVYIGKVKQSPLVIGQSYANWDGSAFIQFTNLTGITIVSSEGTSTPSKSGNNILFTSGTCNELILSNGSTFTFNSGAGLNIWDESINAMHGELNVLPVDFWDRDTTGILRLRLAIDGCFLRSDGAYVPDGVDTSAMTGVDVDPYDWSQLPYSFKFLDISAFQIWNKNDTNVWGSSFSGTPDADKFTWTYTELLNFASYLESSYEDQLFILKSQANELLEVLTYSEVLTGDDLTTTEGYVNQ